MDRRNFLQSIPIIAAIPFIPSSQYKQFWSLHTIINPHVFKGEGFTIISGDKDFLEKFTKYEF